MNLSEIKRCKNTACLKLIYRYQKGWKSNYCCQECEYEDSSVNHHRGVLERNEKRVNMKWQTPQTHYPHCLYPNTVLIIENEELST